MSGKYRFSCGELESVNGYKLRALEPDEQGFYEIVVGCIGVPTRNKVIYDPDSVVAAMSDPQARFNICLREGYLAGEWGHPVVETKDDLSRLLRIDEHYISHYFGKIWIDETPVMINGEAAYRIKAKVKPAGPYGKYLEQSLRDPYVNTSFSVRSLCLPMSGPRPGYEYRQMQIIVTFDAVNAPGFEITNKRYVHGQESFEYDVDKMALVDAIKSQMGMEALPMITDRDVHRLYDDKSITLADSLIATNTCGHRSLLLPSGEIADAASMLYGRKR